MLFTKRICYTAFLGFAIVQSTWAADHVLEKGFLDALRHDGSGLRQERAGKAIQAYKAAGVLPYKAQRSDYSDYYVVGKQTSFMGNQLVLVMEEYQDKYIGCCVNPGAGAYVRVTGNIEPMRVFARKNKCRLEEYSDRKAFLDALPATAGIEPGKYAALLCQESDEVEVTKEVETARPEPQPIVQAAASQVKMASVSGPMLCMINGRSKPTMYLELGANDEFKLVRDGTRPITGRWSSGSFQGQNAIILVKPKSSDDHFPNLYTAYEASIKTVPPNLISLTLARRSTFPGDSSAETYEALCTKSKPLNMEQAVQLTGANQNNNPLRPEVIKNRQQEKNTRPSSAYCTRLEDTYADRPTLQKRLLAQMGCS